MWFKHLHLYRIHEQQLLSPEQMAVILDEQRAKPLGNADPAALAGLRQRVAWVAVS